MDLTDARVAWDRDGFVVIPSYLSEADLAAAVAQLPIVFPSADEFHVDPQAPDFAHLRDEFGGIMDFPFASVELSLLSVHPALTRLAGALLVTEDLRVYSIEAWAKYTGAAEYDQHHHRDYLNHTLLVPSWDRRYRQVEMFLYLSDVPAEMGPPSFVPRRYTEHLAAIPNWLPRHLGVSSDSSWVPHANSRAWHDYVGRASPRQLELFGVPPPGHPYWTPQTLSGMKLRYPNLDLTPWSK